MNHTPGPWEVDDLLTINAPSTLMVAECSCATTRPTWSGTDFSTRARQEANARLIAAAPDYDAVARQILEEVDAEGEFSFKTLERLRAVVAKAEGK